MTDEEAEGRANFVELMVVNAQLLAAEAAAESLAETIRQQAKELLVKQDSIDQLRSDLKEERYAFKQLTREYEANGNYACGFAWDVGSGIVACYWCSVELGTDPEKIKAHVAQCREKHAPKVDWARHRFCGTECIKHTPGDAWYCKACQVFPPYGNLITQEGT